MFAINLTYHQVLGFAREMAKAKEKGTEYHRGVYDAYRDLLFRGGYSDEEIAELMQEACE
ncbi:hypothetical protein [Sporosarcina highlanderae]|uniref:Uncharacterized protein n=1 Tax=Sporosarcina highlanderae TaxID=3035916 RepID=A0ABT8JTY6_9BACL|nr:hypothetical protein [Sporosarcina highlanderae]MDN4608630.1 hypothetical protein [Sporosarcina highlanderae]